jgi:hypothetical protein
MVAERHPTKVIAGVLNISCWTVTAHLRRIFLKRGGVTRLLEEHQTRDVGIQAKNRRLMPTLLSIALSGQARHGLSDAVHSTPGIGYCFNTSL